MTNTMTGAARQPRPALPAASGTYLRADSASGGLVRDTGGASGAVPAQPPANTT